jgi:hypothetical protein
VLCPGVPVVKSSPQLGHLSVPKHTLSISDGTITYWQLGQVAARSRAVGILVRRLGIRHLRLTVKNGREGLPGRMSGNRVGAPRGTSAPFPHSKQRQKHDYDKDQVDVVFNHVAMRCGLLIYGVRAAASIRLIFVYNYPHATNPEAHPHRGNRPADSSPGEAN